jgi:hypothetical protein
MTESLHLLDQVRERDLDLALLSAVYSSEPFRCFLLEKIADYKDVHSVIRTRVSEVTVSGESDLLIVLDLNGVDQLAIMIENKIDAAFQPTQAERYKLRGEDGRVARHWTTFKTCLCAAGVREGEWDSHISLEEICEWASHSEDSHHAFLRAICAQAIAKRESRFRETSPEATDFWRLYLTFATELLPNLNIGRLPAMVGRESPWPRFGTNVLPDDMLLEHKPLHARVDLTFSKCSLEKLREYIPHTLPIDVKMVKAGQSAALRIAVPRIDHFQPFAEQDECVLSVLAAVERMLALGKEIAARRQNQPVAVPWPGGAP